jgi:hypothetical protein
MGPLSGVTLTRSLTFRWRPPFERVAEVEEQKAA